MESGRGTHGGSSQAFLCITVELGASHLLIAVMRVTEGAERTSRVTQPYHPAGEVVRLGASVPHSCESSMPGTRDGSSWTLEQVGCHSVEHDPGKCREQRRLPEQDQTEKKKTSRLQISV